MKSTTKIAIVAASAVAILATAIFIEKRVGNPSSADGRSLAGDPPSLKNSPSKRSPAVSPQRSSGTRNPKASAAEPDLTELKALMQVTDPGIRRTKLAEYLSQIDQADIKPALDYIVSLGPAYENDRGKILKKWVESDPQKAMSWAQKNNPSSVQALLGVWTWKDPDAAIAWADATSSATLDGNPLYPSIISNLNDSPDRIEKVSRLLQSVPPTSKEAAGLSRDVAGYVLAQTKGQESPDDAAKLLGSLPEQWRDNTTQALMAKLMFDDPKKGLDWLRSSTAFSGIAGSDEGIKSMLLYAYQANHEEVVSQYIAGIPSGAERTKFEGQLMQVRKLRAGVPDVQGSRVRLGN